MEGTRFIGSTPEMEIFIPIPSLSPKTLCSSCLFASKNLFAAAELPLALQVAAVREGMSWIVPVPLLSLLTAKQLEQMVCGMPEISVDVLKKVVRYREVDEQHQLVQWFWHTLEEFSNEERVLFMRFVSGRSRLPANTADISQRFQIMKVDRVRWRFSPPGCSAA